jgi:glycosyltransferase involved in cell wall biosynthesis
MNKLMSNSKNNKISVVVPAYRSRDSLPTLVLKLETVLAKLGQEFEIIIIDDCSPDDTWKILGELKHGRSHFKCVRLLRNSGQHNAILCGFSIAEGNIIITMDDDLQNPPEEIPKLLEAISAGYDLVIGAYDSKKHTSARNLGGKMIDGIQRRIFQLPKDFQLTSFRAVRKIVVQNVVAMGGVYPYVTCMLFSHASSYVNVPVRHEPRRFGKSNYNLRRSLLLALNLLLNYSSYPLFFVIALSLVALGLSAGLGGFVVWTVLVDGGSVPGWASTLAAITFFNGLILLALVIHSFYLSRLNQQINRSRVGFTIGERHE